MVIKYFCSEGERFACEPLLVFLDILGSSSSELQQQHKKLVGKRDFLRDQTRRQRNLRSISEWGLGCGEEEVKYVVDTELP